MRLAANDFLELYLREVSSGRQDANALLANDRLHDRYPPSEQRLYTRASFPDLAIMSSLTHGNGSRHDRRKHRFLKVQV